MDVLRLTLVQANLIWENIPANLDHFSSHLKKIQRGSTDLIILPEMFNTGFSMNAPLLFERMVGNTIQWLNETAKSKDCAVCGSMIVKSGEKYFNRLVWMNPSGDFQTYDKRHLFRMGSEEKTYTEGKRKLIVEYKGWRICPLVCYDLRFPVWSRNGKKENLYDLLIYVANWPERRNFAWSQLLIARAIENQTYVVGVNRVGVDGNNISHSGDSIVLDPLGNKLSKTKQAVESVETIKISLKKLQELRKIFPVGMDADVFKIKN